MTKATHQCSNPECAHVFELTPDTEEEHELPRPCPLSCHIYDGDPEDPREVSCTRCGQFVYSVKEHAGCAFLAPRVPRRENGAP